MSRPAGARCLASRDRGSAAAELVLVTPFLVLLLLFAVAAGRLVNARLEVDSAARQAARAASLARTPAAASAQAQAVAQAALAGQSVTCNPAVVIPDTAGLVPGGQVTVQVTCTVRLSDLSLLHLPGSETITSTFTSPVDVYRGQALEFANPESLASGADAGQGGGS